MNSFNINIAVTVGATAELTQLLSALLNCGNLAFKACDTRGCTARTPIAADELAPPTIKYLTEGPQPDNVATSADNVETSATNVATPAEAAPEQPAERIYTEVDVREAMDRTRRRIEGEDYKTNTDGELYQKWHRKLTGWFKNTAAIYGSDKPSALPDSDSRRKFIEDCDRVHTNEDDLTMPIPF